MNLAAKRDKLTSHWWLKTKDGRSVEAYRGRPFHWELCGLYMDGESLLNHYKLDPKQNIVYPALGKHVVPSFCSLRAMLNWIERVRE